MRQLKKFAGARRKSSIAIVGICGLAVLLGAATAGATHVVAGNLAIDFDMDYSPRKLPRDFDAPAKVSGYAKLGTKDGSIPPALSRLVFEFAEFGHLETRGLPKCTQQKLVATTTKQARKLCSGAIVGTGFGEAVVAFPDQAPIPAGSPITLFNGPRIGGEPSIIAHGHLDVPTPTTYLIPIRFETIDRGIYGFRAEARIPKIAGGYGSPTYGRLKVGRDWRIGGRELSYVNLRCATGRLQAHAEATFSDGTILHASLINPCQARKTK